MLKLSRILSNKLSFVILIILLRGITIIGLLDNGSPSPLFFQIRIMNLLKSMTKNSRIRFRKFANNVVFFRTDLFSSVLDLFVFGFQNLFKPEIIIGFRTKNKPRKCIHTVLTHPILSLYFFLYYNFLGIKGA